MEIATFITALASCLTAIVGLFTIYEMKKQRASSHKPILSLQREISVNVRERDLRFVFNEKPLFDEKLILSNTGNEVAYNVQLKFKVNYRKLIKQINSICDGQEIYLINNKHVEFASNSKKFDVRFSQNIKSDDFIFGSIQNNLKKQEICFPSLLSRLLSIVLYLDQHWTCEKHDLKKMLKFESKGLPVKLFLKYEGVGGEKYKKLYKVKLDFEYTLVSINNDKIDQNILNAKICLI